MFYCMFYFTCDRSLSMEIMNTLVCQWRRGQEKTGHVSILPMPGGRACDLSKCNTGALKTGEMWADMAKNAEADYEPFYSPG